ncbi:alpha/beta fold hydrolase [Persicitalea sp.]|uniref:alpha/beta fold hydrolase n=1 Tax=Persicitalea sp. TaxID=3100273 RepID=UPI0035937386
MKKLMGGLALVLCFLQSCTTFKNDDPMAGSKLPAVHKYYQTRLGEMHFVAVGDSTLPPVLFVHGSPGSWDAYSGFLKDSVLQNKAYLMSVDRPGFGESTETAVKMLTEQVEALLPIMKYQTQKVILVGHSLGGPIVARFAMEYPEYVRGLVLAAASVDPDLEPTNWYRYILAVPPVRWIIPRSFESSNEELLPLKKDLRKMVGSWDKINCPVVVIQGGSDVLVPAANADFIEQKLNGRVPLTMIRKKSMNHFVPWSDPELIRSGIQLLLK